MLCTVCSIWIVIWLVYVFYLKIWLIVTKHFSDAYDMWSPPNGPKMDFFMGPTNYIRLIADGHLALFKSLGLVKSLKYMKKKNQRSTTVAVESSCTYTLMGRYISWCYVYVYNVYTCINVHYIYPYCTDRDRPVSIKYRSNEFRYLDFYPYFMKVSVQKNN